MKIPRAAYALLLATTTVACTIMNGLEVPATNGRPDAAKPDADPDDDQDAPDAGEVRCDRRAPFVRFQPIAELNTANDEALPRLTRDELTVYWYGIDSNGTTTVHRARRERRDAPFGDPVPILADRPFSRTPAPTPDGARLFFAVGEIDFGIFVARVTESGVADVRAIKTPATAGESFAMPWLVGSRLYYTRSTASNGDLWVANVDADGNLTDETPIAGLNTDAYELDQTVSSDDLTIYFYSERERVEQGRIFVAHREDAAQPFETPAVVAEIERPPGGWVAPGYLSDDLCRLYFYRGVDQGDLFVAERDP